MANDGFNGATIVFDITGVGAAATFGGLRSLEFSESAPKVNVTHSASTTTAYRTGIPDPQLVATWVGGLPSTLANVGDQGSLVVTWPDGTSDGSIANTIIVDKSVPLVSAK